MTRRRRKGPSGWLGGGKAPISAADHAGASALRLLGRNEPTIANTRREYITNFFKFPGRTSLVTESGLVAEVEVQERNHTCGDQAINSEPIPATFFQPAAQPFQRKQSCQKREERSEEARADAEG